MYCPRSQDYDMSGDPLDRNSMVTSHVGIDTMTRLMLWATEVAKAFKCDVVLGGSALRHKGWRDLDVTLLFKAERHTQISTCGWGQQAWWMACSALSLQASAMVGATVEVHINTDNWGTPSYQFLELAKAP